MTTRLRAALGFSLLAFAPALGVEAEGQSFAVGGSAVTPSIDHTAKVITLHARLLLYPSCSGPQSICQITATDVRNIKKKITDVWNQGHMFSCYDVRVDIQIQVGTQLPPVGAGQVGIQIDQSAKSFYDKAHDVKTVPNSTSKWAAALKVDQRGSVRRRQGPRRSSPLPLRSTRARKAAR